MHSLKVTASALGLSLLLGGCAAESLSHSNMLDGVTTKAEYRVILRGERKEDAKQQMVTCAEPSPDAMKAFSMALSGGLQNLAPGGNQTSATAALALQNSMAEIGVRTATIQMLRDGLHRACEAYMNGALDKEEYMLLLAHYPRTMATVTAIEVLGSGQYPSKAVLLANAGTEPPPNVPDPKDPAKAVAPPPVKVGASNAITSDGQRSQASADAIKEIVLALYRPENDPLLGSCAMALAGDSGKTKGAAFRTACTDIFKTLPSLLKTSLEAAAQERIVLATEREVAAKKALKAQIK